MPNDYVARRLEQVICNLDSEIQFVRYIGRQFKPDAGGKERHLAAGALDVLRNAALDVVAYGVYDAHTRWDDNPLSQWAKWEVDALDRSADISPDSLTASAIISAADRAETIRQAIRPELPAPTLDKPAPVW